MRPFFVAFFALMAFTHPVFAQAKHPFTFEDMMKLKRVGEPVISPDGKWVIFSVVDVSLEANTKTPHIWIVPTAGGGSHFYRLRTMARRYGLPGLTGPVGP